MARITIRPNDVKMGVRRAEISGYHKPKEDPVRQKIKTRKVKAHNFRPEEIDEMKWTAENSDRRGNRATLNYRGTTPYYWRKNEFTNTEQGAGGLGIDSGASRGGDHTIKPLKARAYKEGVFGDTSDINNPDPFRVRMNTKIKLKV